MRVEIDKMVSAILKKLDENEEIVAERVEYGIPDTEVCSLIRSLLPEVAESVILQAPRRQIDEWDEFSADVDWEGPGHGRVELPSDFLRFISFRMSDWTRPVVMAVDCESEEYLLRFYPGVYRKGIRKAPAVAILDGARGKNLEFIGGNSPGAYLERCCYVPRPYDESREEILLIPRGLVAAVEDAVAEKVGRIRA